MLGTHHNRPTLPASVWLLTLGAFLLAAVSCRSPASSNQPVRRTQDTLDPGWTKAQKPWRQTSVLKAGWDHGKLLWRPASLSAISVPHPRIEDAESNKIDKLCATCHESFFQAFASNVHRDQGCDACHGASGQHMKSRGKEPSAIISLKKRDDASEAGRLTTPAERNEVCLRCHENEPHSPGTTWRTSVHAHNNVACTDCHTVHYNVPPGTPPTVLGMDDPDNNGAPASLANFSSAPDLQSLRGKSNNLAAKSPDDCYRCHTEMKRLEQVAHPHQIGGVNNFNCTTCHDTHGNVLHETRRDHCLKCHTGAHMNEWNGSPHDVAGIGCTDCHNPHPESGVPMSVDQPNVCYRCHSEKRELEEIAHAHQVLGPNGFNCDTCHRPHGTVTSGDPIGPLSAMPPGRPDDGVALVGPLPRRRRLRGLPQGPSTHGRTAGGQRQPHVASPPQANADVSRPAGRVLQMSSQDICYDVDAFAPPDSRGQNGLLRLP